MWAYLTILGILALGIFLRRAKEKKQANTDIYERQLAEIRRLTKNTTHEM